MRKLNLKYRILSTDKRNNSIIVRYWTDILSEKDLSDFDEITEDGTPTRCSTDSNIVLWNDIKTPADLEKIILDSAPIRLLENKENFKTQDVNVFDGLVEGFLNKVHKKEIDISTPPPPPPAVTETIKVMTDEEKAMTDEEIEELLNNLMTNK